MVVLVIWRWVVLAIVVSFRIRKVRILMAMLAILTRDL